MEGGMMQESDEERKQRLEKKVKDAMTGRPDYLSGQETPEEEVDQHLPSALPNAENLATAENIPEFVMPTAKVTLAQKIAAILQGMINTLVKKAADGQDIAVPSFGKVTIVAVVASALAWLAAYIAGC